MVHLCRCQGYIKARMKSEEKRRTRFHSGHGKEFVFSLFVLLIAWMFPLDSMCSPTDIIAWSAALTRILCHYLVYWLVSICSFMFPSLSPSTNVWLCSSIYENSKTATIGNLFVVNTSLTVSDTPIFGSGKSLGASLFHFQNYSDFLKYGAAITEKAMLLIVVEGIHIMASEKALAGFDRAQVSLSK